MEMSIEGLESLMAKLRRLGGSVDEAIDKGIGKGVQKIKSDAKVNCPYDTGRLKGSISTEHLELKVWAVGTNVEYAMFVEFGTGQHGAPGVPHTMQPWRYKDAKGKYHAFRQLYNATDKLVYAGQEDSAVSLYGKTVSISGTNSITSNKSITVSSDARVKNHISDLPSGSENLFDYLSGKSFFYNGDTSTARNYGFIAQDVLSALQKCGLSTNDFAGFCDINGDGSQYALAYEQFIPIMWDEIKRLRKALSERS